jgi:hypothetical protein
VADLLAHESKVVSDNNIFMHAPPPREGRDKKGQKNYGASMNE